MSKSKLTALCFAVLANGCASNSGDDLLATSTQVFQLNGAVISISFINSLRGCYPTAGLIENKRTEVLGFVYTQLYAATMDGRTVGTWGVNFPPTVPGGSARAVVITGGGGAGLQCQGLQFHINA